MVTYSELLQLLLLIVTAISLFYSIYKDKKQFLNIKKKQPPSFPDTVVSLTINFWGEPLIAEAPFVFSLQHIFNICQALANDAGAFVMPKIKFKEINYVYYSRK